MTEGLTEAPFGATEMKEEPKTGEFLNISVKDQDGGETWFKLKKTTKLIKMMNAYCERNAKDIGSIRFLYDGQRVGGEQTPEQLGMEDSDSIDAMVPQVGGH